MSVTLAARTKLHRQTAAGGGSSIVPEMILALSWLQLEVINELFVSRFLGDLQGEPTSWRHLVITFLAKVSKANELANFRGICLSDVFAKWYVQGLMMLVRSQERCLSNRSWHKLLIFGFEPNHSTAQIIMCLNILLSKGHEWHGQDDVFIGQGDVKAAFDNLTLTVVLDAMKFWKFDPSLTRALLEESLSLMAEARFPGIDSTIPFPFNRSIRQGGVEAPWQWNVTMRHLLALLVPSWERRGLGIKVPYVNCLTHFVWADNLYFLASSLVNLQVMMQEFTDLLVHAKLSWKSGSLQVMYSGSVPNDCCFNLQQDPAMDCGSIAVESVDVMEVLGAKLSSTGSSITILEHRLSKATSCFYSLGEFFLNRAASLWKKFDEFARRVQPIALYTSEACSWSQTIYNMLLRWENTYLRRICQIKRLNGETFAHYLPRATRTARQWFHHRGFKSVATLMLERQHRIIGASFQRLSLDLEARLPAGTPNTTIVEQPLALNWRARKPSFSIIALTLLWKSQAWWEWQQALMTTVDAQNELMWRHGRRGRQVQWEHPLCKVFGNKWMQLAISRGWQDRKAKLVDGAYGLLHIRPLEQRFAKPILGGVGKRGGPPLTKAPRQVVWEPQDWTLSDNFKRLEVCGDSSLIVNWFNGVWPVRFLPYFRRVSCLHQQLHELVLHHAVRPRQDTSDFCRHVFRELNTKADELANRHCNTWSIEPYSAPAACVRAFFDGSVKGDKAAFGWIVLECQTGDGNMGLWRAIASKSSCLPDGATITAAELEGSLSLVSFLLSYYQGYDKALSNICTFSPMRYDIINALMLADLV